MVFWVDAQCGVTVEAQIGEAAQSSEMQLPNHHTTWRNNPKNCKL